MVLKKFNEIVEQVIAKISAFDSKDQIENIINNMKKSIVDIAELPTSINHRKVF